MAIKTADPKQEADLWWTHDRFRVNWEEFVCCQVRAMKPTQRPNVCLAPETGMFSWMACLLISGGPLWSLLCLAWVCHCHRLLVEVVDWCVSRLAKLISCWIILMATNPKSLFICYSLAIHLWDLPPLPSGQVRSGICTLMVSLIHWICFLFFLWELLMFWPHILVYCFGGLLIWVVFQLAGDSQCHPNSKGSTILLCCQLLTDFHNISNFSIV